MSSDDIQYNEDNRLAHKMEQGGLARNGSAHWIDELIQYSTRFTNELEKLRALFNAAKGWLKTIFGIQLNCVCNVAFNCL